MQHIPSNFTPEEVLGFVPDDNVLKPIVEKLLKEKEDLEHEISNNRSSLERIEEQNYFMKEFLTKVKRTLENERVTKGIAKELLIELENSYIEL